MKILLVVPKYTRAPGEFYQFPLGLGYISSALKHAGHQVDCVNCNNRPEPTEQLVAEAMQTFDPEICATGGLSPFLPQIRTIFNTARRMKPTIINMAGGGVLSSDPEAGPSVMDIDVGVIGEGEATVVDLVDALEKGRDLHTVPGIVFVAPHGDQPPVGVARRLERGDVIRTAPRDSIHDLGSLPWPDYAGLGFIGRIDMQRAHDIYFYHSQDKPRCVDMITSRSCPYRCTFCFHPTGKVYRERPLDDFFAELDHLVKDYGINMVAIIDELFSLKKERLLEFCERIKPYGLQWMVQLHVNCADDPILDAMKDAGCTYISYGVESMDNGVLQSMQKGSRRERIDHVLGKTYEKHIGIQGNLIFGDSAETLDTANNSMAWWAAHREYMVNVDRLQVYPGSPDYIQAVRDGLIRDRVKYIDDLEIYLNISKMNDDDLEMLGKTVSIAQAALLELAPVTAFEPCEDELATAEYPSWRIGWDCPRCHHANDFHQVRLREGRHAIRLTCRGCFARYDVENQSRRPYEKKPELPTLKAAFASASALHGEARAAALEALIAQAPWFHPAHTALAEHHLTHRMGGPNLADERAAIHHLGQALFHNPFDPQLQLNYADGLLRRGAAGMAKLHVEQALKLDPAHGAAQARLQALQEPHTPADQLQTFFASYSEAAAPLRLNPETGPKKHKREAEFPDISAIEEAVGARLSAAG